MTNYIEIDLEKLSYNIRELKRHLEKNVKFFAVVKANAYGHGLIEVSKKALKSGASALVCFSSEEGLKLRAAGITEPIYLVGYTDPDNLEKAIKQDLIITVTSIDQIQNISKIADHLNKKAKIDLKVETGMNRFGLKPENLIKEWREISRLPNIEIVAVHSHFADALNGDYSNHQIKEMKKVLSGIKFADKPVVHMAATEASYRYKDAQFDAVRIGIGIYGYADSKELKDRVKQVLSLKSKIAQIKEIDAGESVSYCRTFLADKKMKLAVLPIGYSDGLPRALSNLGEVLVRGKRATIIGSICMNVTIVDVSGIKCSEGDEVVLIGESGNDKIDAEEIGSLIGTNPHEILTGLSEFLPRIYK